MTITDGPYSNPTSDLLEKLNEMRQNITSMPNSHIHLLGLTFFFIFSFKFYKKIKNFSYIKINIFYQ